MNECPKCQGEGLVYTEWRRFEGEAGEEVCRTCGGSGQVEGGDPSC